jgi:CubicO group peptidase (beta-lactamase class C family)
MLVERGRLRLDEPVSHLLARSRWMSSNRPAMALDPDAYAAWSEAPKSGVTTRQLLLHLSGLPKNGTNLTYQSSNEFMYIPLMSPPGERFHYSNVGAEVLGVVLSVAAGRFLHEFIYRELYAPLGIKSGRFSRSSEGYPFVAGSMQLGMHDLAVIGELIAGEGTFRGTTILSPHAVEEMLRPGILSRTDAEAAATQNDFLLASGMMWWRDLGHDIVQTWGYLHNDLLVLPKSGLVAVRLQSLPPAPHAGADGKTFALHRAELLERLSAQISQ